MGIKDINKFIRSKEVEFEFKAYLSDLSGHRVAIDALNWLYTYMPMTFKNYMKQYNIADEVDQEKVFNMLLVDLLDFISVWIEKNITPVFVWDGDHPFLKTETRAKRRAQRAKKMEELKEQLEVLRSQHFLSRDPIVVEKWKNDFAQNTRLEDEYINLLKEVIISIGIPSFTAEGDGEKHCAQLNIEGQVIGVWSRDTDLYALGAIHMITSVRENDFDFIDPQKIREALGMDLEQFRDFCIMCGCDFNDNIKGWGPVKVYKLFKEHNFDISEIKSVHGEKYNFDQLKIEECRKLLSVDSETHYQDIDFDSEMYKEIGRQVLEQYGCHRFIAKFNKFSDGWAHN